MSQQREGMFTMYDTLKELLFGLQFEEVSTNRSETFTIVAVGDINKTGASIQIRSENFLLVAHLYIDEEVFITKGLKQSDLEILFDGNKNKRLTCRLKTIGNRTLNSI